MLQNYLIQQIRFIKNFLKLLKQHLIAKNLLFYTLKSCIKLQQKIFFEKLNLSIFFIILPFECSFDDSRFEQILCF